MKIYKNPKRYQFQFDDHSMDNKQDYDCQTIAALDEVPRLLITTTGWLLAEDSRAYMVSGALFTDLKDQTTYFSDVWTILKVKGLVKVRCDD